MDKRIELELRGRDPSEVTELNLDNCRATAVSGLTEDFKSLETLSMINVGLTSLKGLPPLPSLQRLDLSENRLSGNLDQLLCCPHIEYLNLAGNKISTLEVLEPLKKLEELRSLDLFGCELAASDDYRKNVFEDEDETEDFAPGDDEETDEAGSPRGVKRKHDGDDDDENGEDAKREA
uniref:LRRcap domain-containing protein n=1 Tax=Elaeophora elaphi TaxID=1147741 RepID=A0A0R3RQF9_9BILA